MKNEKVLKYTVSAMISIMLLHFAIFPGLENPNTVTKTTSLVGFFLVVFWALGFIHISFKKDS